MASATISNLERGEYQQVADITTSPVDPVRVRECWRRLLFFVAVPVGVMGAICAVMVVFRLNEEIDGSSNVAVSKIHKTEIKASIAVSRTEKRLRTDVTQNSSRWTTTTTTTTTAIVTTSTTDLLPVENRHDGNSCEDNEEIFLGLCYKKCIDLTNGNYPVRSSPFSCCKSNDCFAHEKVESWIPCQGYDVNGKHGCPHAPGACLVDEEYHLGLCYKKCNILTNGSYPHRIAPATCCKDDGFLCLDFVAEDWTDRDFAVGGGQGDNSASTPRAVHGPIYKLTEGSGLISPALADLNITKSSVRPAEQRHDGNTCENNEELLAGLCYKKCANLTNGEYPIRSSAFTCCKDQNCLFQQKMGNDVPMPCQGYDVSGHDGCPHGPGACLEDEQLFLGMCYAKCNLLTGGQYPYRVGPMTCCRKNNELDCLSPFSSNRVSDTSSSYDIAGGGGDRDRTTPGHVHAPLQFLTEEA